MASSNRTLRPARHTWCALVAVSMVLVACSARDPEDAAGDAATTTTVAEAIDPSSREALLAAGATVGPRVDSLAVAAVEATEVGRANRPVAISARAGSTSLYVGEQAGRVREVGARLSYGNDGEVRSISYSLYRGSVLDVSDQVERRDDSPPGRGLIDLTFSPDGRALYLLFTDRDGVTMVTSYRMDGDRVNTRSSRTVLRLERPVAERGATGLSFGPDGFLYVSLGDGGSGGDATADAQDPATMFGAIVRIDPDTGDPERGYDVPAANPFAEAPAGAEVWTYGVRHPSGASFDPVTGDLWLAERDLGPVDVIVWMPAVRGGAGRGANLGWGRLGVDDGAAAGTYAHAHAIDRSGDPCGTVGGFIYRGSALEGLEGAYLFGDRCAPQLQALLSELGQSIEVRGLGVEIPELVALAPDANGEPWALSHAGAILRLVPS